MAEELSRHFLADIRWYSGEPPKVFLNKYKFNRYRYREKSYNAYNDFEQYKLKVQRDYKENKFPLLVATKAFGMGIDKPNIRYTIHFGLPTSLESLYQEAGRAGRDKEPAECYVIYSKERIREDELEKLFNPDTSVEEIRSIQKKYSFDGDDVLRIFFLWLSTNKGTDEEFNIMKYLFDRFAQPKTIKLIEIEKLPYEFYDIQKAIYRLSLLKIVDDWTIEKWDRGLEVIKAYFDNYNPDTVLSSLLE